MVNAASGLNQLEQQLKLEKAQVRRAIRTMVVIITSYLACNSLHVCLYSLEMFWPNFLVIEDTQVFQWYYVLCSDMVSILFMVSSMIRLYIYYKYNADTRNEILDTLGCHKKRDRIRAQIRLGVNGRLLLEAGALKKPTTTSLSGPETEELLL
jgi:hypothetical protein